ncbi:unnamed protein product [Rotaria sp. Silwood2]|nr:unnamed protein product [Rotaria sp. Silwood2]CAF2940991.1 unnamed protein product [Rotaria sp. Silwood2]CAF4533269.1 unnamed protein product [Rotaria sp. Silwood2]
MNDVYEVKPLGGRKKTVALLPDRIVCVLPLRFIFHGPSSIIPSQQSHLTRTLCYAMIDATYTGICLFKSATISIDDQIMGRITQYDI